LALAAQTKKPVRSKGKKKEKTQSGIICNNCKWSGHRKPDCYSKGGGKEGQGPRQRKAAKSKESKMALVVAADNEEKELFVFTCTSNYVDRTKFTNYKLVEWKITTANRRMLTAIGMGDLNIELPNGSVKTKTVFKNAIHAPEMAFTLISISRLDKAGFSVTFHKGMCTIINPKGWTIATIPHSEGLYKVVAMMQFKKSKMANAVTRKMSMTDAHKKLSHISCSSLKYAIANGLIDGIDVDITSKPDFCKACAKAKSVCQPLPKESDTRAEKFGKQVHWDLWGLASVKSMNGHYYVAAQIDNATRQTKLYFQDKKSQTFILIHIRKMKLT
jgi:hypothetical protein